MAGNVLGWWVFSWEGPKSSFLKWVWSFYMKKFKKQEEVIRIKNDGSHMQESREFSAFYSQEKILMSIQYVIFLDL